MKRPQQVPLPDFTLERLLDRVAEALRVGFEPAKLHEFPAWTQRVMRILKEQFVPREFISILSGDGSIFAEGIAVAWAARAEDLAHPRSSGVGEVAQRLAEKLSVHPKAKEAVSQVESGTFTASAELQAQVMKRLFAADFAERREFVEGLAIGTRLPELLDRQMRRSTTDATGIYLLLWCYWPEISRLKSVPEVARALEPFFLQNRNLAGVHWEERIRKLANRIGLSFKGKQKRRRKGTRE